MFKKSINSAGALILLGILQRVVTTLICHSHFENLGGVIYSLGSGILFDISFISGLFLFGFIFHLAFKSGRVNTFYQAAIFIWILLNTLDLFSIHYNGVRASLNSFNLFSLEDIIDKLDFSLINLLVVFFLLGFSWIYFKKKNVFVPSHEIVGLKNKFIYVSALIFCSFIYLPFPLNYYNDQAPVSKESRQLAVNPYFSWSTSFLNRRQRDLIKKEIAFENFKKQQGSLVNTDELFLRNVDYSDSAYDQVIIIMMESFGANRIGVLGGEQDLSPFFDSLCKEGTLYSKCFACGPRTQYGISSVLFGFPHILGYNLFRENKLKLKFMGLSNLLSKNEYKSHFLHGGSAAYDDMSLLINSDNKVALNDVNDIKEFQFRNSWGVDDESFFNYSNKYITKQSGKNLYCLLTMSNHEPFQLPAKYENANKGGNLKKSERALRYSDYALGGFIKKIKQSGVFKRSLIIITGDHGERYSGSDKETKLFHVPLLIIDHKSKGKIIERPTSHADIAEYILSKTGFKGKSHFLGLNFAKRTTPLVYYRDYDNNVYKVTDSCVYKFNLYSKQLSKLKVSSNMYVKNEVKLNDKNANNNKIVEDMLSYYTVSRFLFESGVYHN